MRHGGCLLAAIDLVCTKVRTKIRELSSGHDSFIGNESSKEVRIHSIRDGDLFQKSKLQEHVGG